MTSTLRIDKLRSGRRFLLIFGLPWAVAGVTFLILLMGVVFTGAGEDPRRLVLVSLGGLVFSTSMVGLWLFLDRMAEGLEDR